MNDEGNGPQEPSPEELEAEVERLKAERQELEARVETLEAKPQKRRRLRRVLTPILVVLSIIVFTVAVPAAWGARTVLNTDRYVATVGPLADDPAVQASIATKLTDQVFSALDVEGTISDALAGLGERATVLAGPLTTAVKGFVQDQVQKVVASDAFKTFWVAANRFVHTQVLAILRGEGDTVSVREGKVLLNLLPLVNLALGSIQTVASDLVGRDVTLPQITKGEVPSASIAKLEQALGVDLPDYFGQIVVYDSEDLAGAAAAPLRVRTAAGAAVALDPDPRGGEPVGLDAATPDADPAHRGRRGGARHHPADRDRSPGTISSNASIRSGSPRCASSRTS